MSQVVKLGRQRKSLLGRLKGYTLQKIQPTPGSPTVLFLLFNPNHTPMISLNILSPGEMNPKTGLIQKIIFSFHFHSTVLNTANSDFIKSSGCSHI